MIGSQGFVYPVLSSKIYSYYSVYSAMNCMGHTRFEMILSELCHFKNARKINKIINEIKEVESHSQFFSPLRKQVRKEVGNASCNSSENV